MIKNGNLDFLYVDNRLNYISFGIRKMDARFNGEQGTADSTK